MQLLLVYVAMAMAMTTGPAANVHQLKDDLPWSSKEDAMELVPMPKRTPASINPVLLSSACSGSSKELTCLFKQEDEGRPPSMVPSREFINSIMKGGSSSDEDDVEEGIDQQPVLPAAAPPLLKGVTMAGDTALHAVASHGDDEEFFKCADIIYERAKHLLFAKNNKGDTPLHCAVRAGKSRMVSHLIALATSEDDHRKHKLLRDVNGLQETALHDAVRIGDEKMVEKLMELDPELANYPKDQGVSPLYLAILLYKHRIAQTLHRQSNGNLSYSGPNGQNALHIAILRPPGTYEMHLLYVIHIYVLAYQFPMHSLVGAYMSSGLINYCGSLLILFLLWFRNYMIAHKISIYYLGSLCMAV